MSKTPDSVRVWDLPVRVGHWALVLGVLLAWVTRHGFGSVHEWIGYVVLGVVLFRVLWGFWGTPYARFAQFTQSPGTTLDYIRDVRSHREKRYLGHNPLGGWMTLLLLSTLFIICFTGWLYTTDRFWGIAWVEALHNGSTNFLIGLVAVHVSGVIWTSLKTRENLIACMIHGRKRAPRADDER